MRKIVLASSSPTRKELMEKLGIPFVIEPSTYEEDMSLKLPPKKLAEKLAHGKAAAVAKNHKDAIVIGADTFVTFRGKLLGKPGAPAAAIRMLKMLSGKTHSIITGLVLLDTQKKKEASKTVETHVTFRKLTLSEIKRYVNTGEPLKKAGAYGILERGALFVERVDGDYTNVAGLPLPTLVVELRRMGIELK